MNNWRSNRTVSLTLAFALAATHVAAGEDGFKFSDLNPFHTTSSRTDEGTRNGLRLPSLPSPPSLPKPSVPKFPDWSLPKLELPKAPSAVRKANTPSTWTRISRGTSSIFNKTKTTLMPWTAEKPRPKPSSRVASRPEKPSFIENLFGAREREQKIETVNDYLKLPRAFE